MESSIESLKNQLFDIWTDAKIPDNEWAPLVPHLPEKGSVLFVGMNPSFSDRAWKKVVRESGHASADPHEELSWGNRATFDVSKWMEIERTSLKVYSYFKVFNAFGESTGCSWDHIDLFQYRHTSQRYAESQLLESRNPLKLRDFGSRQLSLSLNLIEQSQPRAIVSVNALGSRILRETARPVFDAKLGCHLLQLNGRLTPTFFSSMLTGQRALDVFSRMRLFWHLSQVLDIPFPAETWETITPSESCIE